MAEIVMVPLSNLMPNPVSLRVLYDKEIIYGLAGSIDQYGIKGLLLVRGVGDKFQVGDGNYRYHAVSHRVLRKRTGFSDMLTLKEPAESSSNGQKITEIQEGF